MMIRSYSMATLHTHSLKQPHAKPLVAWHTKRISAHLHNLSGPTLFHLYSGHFRPPDWLVIDVNQFGFFFFCFSSSTKYQFCLKMRKKGRNKESRHEGRLLHLNNIRWFQPKIMEYHNRTISSIYEDTFSFYGRTNLSTKASGGRFKDITSHGSGWQSDVIPVP